jgi:putative ABC transport system substrate-binding protein
MDRRTFLAGTGAVLLAAPLAAEAQQEKKLPRIGFLVFTSSELRYRGFQQGLRELSYVEGQNIVIEFRSADGSLERLNDLARELVRLPVDVLVAGSTLGAEASKRATSNTVPIVMANVPIPSSRVSCPAWPGRAETSPGSPPWVQSSSGSAWS